jgi:hypothetical protein
MSSKVQTTHMLNSNEICVNERDMIGLAESADDAVILCMCCIVEHGEKSSNSLQI